jgi:hypothetical protein
LNTMPAVVPFTQRCANSGHIILTFALSQKQDCPTRPFWFTTCSAGLFGTSCRILADE